MKIIILDGYAENPGDLSWEGFEKLGELTVYDRTPREDVEEILRRIGDAEIICTNKTLIGREVIERAPKLRYIGVLATGYNVVDVNAAAEKGIPVTNIPAYGTAAVAYIPQGEVVGLSKIARTVEVYAKRLQLQERMTAQIADAFMEKLAPKIGRAHV